MQIYWAKGAKQNLNHIEEYIAKDNLSAAIDTVFKIIETVKILSEHPEMGRLGRIAGTRELVISGTSYIIPYRVEKKNIEILRVLHGAMQWPESIN